MRVFSCITVILIQALLLPVLCQPADVSSFAPPRSEKIVLNLPLYCVDETVLAIFSPRLKCLKDGWRGVQEDGSMGINADRLQAQGWEEHQRAHELIAYEWLVLTKNNPFRRPCSDSAVKLEYVPLLPLHTVAVTKGTSESIGGPSNQSYVCSYPSLIADIEKYMAARANSDRSSTLKPFSVAGTLNMRTQMGVWGMASQARRGPQYDTVTAFVTSTFLGHYERFPQCPDLLRKHWLGVFELPYVQPSFHSSLTGRVEPLVQSTSREIKFLFVGRMWLFGPERVCSVRNAIAGLSKSSFAINKTLVVVNTTATATFSLHTHIAISPAVLDLYSRAVFCLVAKGDSYSTAALYAAVDSGCIPVLISDWLAPAFNWAVPWADFAVRVNEQDFLSSPEKALRSVENTYGLKVERLRQEGLRWRALLSYNKVPAESIAKQRADISHYTLPDPGPGLVVPALELFLYELLYHPGVRETPSSSTNPVVTGLSCETPYHCPLKEFLVPPLKVVGLGPKGAGDERSYLCQNVHRFVGQYKMVFNQKCVRILWPLRPGYFKPYDSQLLSEAEKEFVTRFHQQGFSASVYPFTEQSLSATYLGHGVIPLSSLLKQVI